MNAYAPLSRWERRMSKMDEQHDAHVMERYYALRRARIVATYEAGWSYVDVGLAFGITPVRVRQIVMKNAPHIMRRISSY